MPVLIAIIVCEGDVTTISHVSKAVQCKLPVIIMKGSGMASDLILNYIERYDIFIKILTWLLSNEQTN